MKATHSLEPGVSRKPLRSIRQPCEKLGASRMRRTRRGEYCCAIKQYASSNYRDGKRRLKLLAQCVRVWVMQSCAAQAITMYDNWGKAAAASSKMMAKARLYRSRAYRSSEHRDRVQAARLATNDLEIALSYEPKDRTIRK